MRLCLCWLVTGLLWFAGPLWAQGPVLSPDERGDARFLAAREYASRGDTARLEQFYTHPESHPLEPWVGYWLWSARIARLSEPVDAQGVRDYLQRYDGQMLAERLRGEWLKRLGLTSQWSDFNDEYAKLQQPDTELLCYAVRARGPMAEAALQTLDAQWLIALEAPDACAAPLQSLVDSGRKTQDEVLWRLRRQVEANKLPAARATLALLPEREAPDAGMLGRVFDNPARFLATPAARSPSGRAARELVLAAIARLARSDARGSYSRWSAVDENRFSASERAYAIGQLAWGGAIAQIPEASQWFGVARGLMPNQPMSDEQAAWQVRAALRVGDWSAVQASIEMMNASLRDAPEWTFWLGRAMIQSNRLPEARALYERHAGEPSFYGILAAERLGRPLAWPQAALPPTVQEMQRVEASGEVQRAMALLRLDMRMDAIREWNWGMSGGGVSGGRSGVVRAADDRFLIAAAEYARRLGYYDRAISAADRTRTQHDYSLRFLAPYFDVFAREAAANKLDLHWVYGVTRQESRFHPVAKSAVGAQGLMQIMPATGRAIARRIGLTGFNVSHLAETEPNVQIGTAYLRTILNDLFNSPLMATAAYNAGPGRARRWRDGKPLEGAIYAETIPFTETRDYVKKVMANTIAYSVLLDGKPMSLTQFLGTVPADTGEPFVEASR